MTRATGSGPEQAAALDAAVRSGPVILQTDTVYCLAAACGGDGGEEIHRAKGRPTEERPADAKPPYLPIVVGAQGQLADLGVRLEGPAKAFAEAFWPGPLTLVTGLGKGLPRPSWLSGRGEVAVRLPAFEPLRELALRVGPLFVTSANRTGHPVAGSRGEASAVFDNRFPIFEWPDRPSGGIPSTILNARRDPPAIQRPGAISPVEIMTVYERYLTRSDSPRSDFVVGEPEE